MDRTTIFLDRDTKTIVEAKAKELTKAQGPTSTGAAIRAIILEWHFIASVGQAAASKQAAK